MPARLEPGTFLIASPNLDYLGDGEAGDPNFNRTVVLILQHEEEGSLGQDEGGTLGLIVNRPLGDKVKLQADGLEKLTDGLHAMHQIPLEPASMFYQGGPVDPGSLVFLHQLGDQIEDSMEICDGVYAGGKLENLRAHAAVINADNPMLRFYLGFASWRAGQLENEIGRRDSWILCPATADLVFSTKPDRVWQQALYSLGDKYRTMSLLPEDLTLN